MQYHTIRLLALRRVSPSHLSRVFQVDMPTANIALVVLEVKGEDGLPLLDGIFLLGSIALKRAIDIFECD